MRVVADAGPLIHLSWIDQLSILQELYEETFAPQAVLTEITRASGARGVPAIQRAVASGLVVERRVESLPWPPKPYERPLGKGESEAIMLATDVNDDLLLCDDAHARSEAGRQGIRTLGTIGILTQARDRGLLNAVLPYVLELRALGQWISDKLVEAVQADEQGHA